MTVPILRNPYHWPRLYNGATWDDYRNNTQGTLLASAARTAQTDSPAQTNYNARGVLIFLNVTVASGTGGLQVGILYTDPVSGTNKQVNANPTAVTATGIKLYAIAPAITGWSLDQATQGQLPRTWFARVFVGDTSAYTYSLGYAYLL